MSTTKPISKTSSQPKMTHQIHQIHQIRQIHRICQMRQKPRFCPGRVTFRVGWPIWLQETAQLIEDVTYDGKGRAIPKLYSKLQANKELRAMLNIRAKEAPRDITRSRMPS